MRERSRVVMVSPQDSAPRQETTMTITDEPTSIDVAAAERFGERVVGALNDASLALMLSIGHQAGLLDTLARLEPSTAADVARQSGLQERYVREWLAAVTTAGVVVYDPATMTYELPAEHAACLTRAAVHHGGDTGWGSHPYNRW